MTAQAKEILLDNIKDKIKGCIYGQAIGDALGLGTEFMTRAEVKRHYPNGLERYDQIIQDHHRQRWQRGEWTDDTDMMLCIAKARHDNHFDIETIAHNFKNWFNGCPRGIGLHTSNVLAFGDYTQAPIKASQLMWRLSKCTAAANGALMRTSILGTSPVVKNNEIEDICKLTHYDARCIGSCVIIVKIIQNLIFEDKQLNIQELEDIAAKYDNRIIAYLEKSTVENPYDLSPDDEFQGYTLKTLALALWCLWHEKDFKAGLLDIVNLGGDADTNGAVACSMLGAKYGFSSIPKIYTDNLINTQILEETYIKAISDFTQQQ